MKTLRNVTVLLMLMLLCEAKAQQVVVNELYKVSSVALKTPLFVDSTDINGGKFSLSNALNSFVPPATVNYHALTVLSPDTAMVYRWSKPTTDGAINYFEFKIYAPAYSKIKLQIAAVGDFMVYINGVKRDAVPGSGLNLANATEKSLEINLLTQTYTIGVACLTTKKQEHDPALKLAFSDEKKMVRLVETSQTKRKLSYPDVINVTYPYEVSISSNATYYMTKLTSVLPGGDKQSWLEVYDRTNAKCILKTSSRLEMAWMPVSELLYYVEKQGDKRLLKTFNPSTMEEKVLSPNLPEGWIRWSPDESYLIISGTDKYAGAEKDFKYYMLPNDRFAGWRNRTILFKYDLATGATSQLTFGSKSMSVADISPDGKSFILRTNEITITKRPFSSSSFYQYHFDTDKVDTLWLNQSFVNDIQYSPDGKSLLVLGAPAAFNKLGENIGKRPYSNDFDVQAYLYDFATAKLSAISKTFDPAIQQAFWNKPGNIIYFKVVDRDYESLYAYSLQTKSYTKVSLDVDVVQQLSFSSDNQFVAYRGMSASYPTKAYLHNLTTNTMNLIADPEKDKMSQIALGLVQDYNFKSKDGSVIYGRYYLPSDFDVQKKYPLIVYYYGGTTPTPRTFGSNWNFHYWASMGYVVYVVQPSGAIGFGQAFSAKHVNSWGNISSDDIIQGVKNFSATHPYVDSKKIGCLGASYGGYMTMHLQTKTNIFATAITHAGISALSSYWGNGYWGYAYSAVATSDTYPWSNPKFYTDHSPLFHANKINTPLLIIQGDDDTNVPAGESMQMFTAMKILGKEVAMVRVKDEDHIITAYQRRIDWNYSIMAWMAKYLQNDPSWWESIYPEAKVK